MVDPASGRDGVWGASTVGRTAKKAVRHVLWKQMESIGGVAYQTCHGHE
jgi:hypothetical protein